MIDSYTVATTTGSNASSNQGGNSVVATENAMMDGMQTLVPYLCIPDTDINSKY